MELVRAATTSVAGPLLTAENFRRDLTVGSIGCCASRSDLCSRSGTLAAGPARRRIGPVGIESMLVAPGFAEDLDTVAMLHASPGARQEKASTVAIHTWIDTMAGTSSGLRYEHQ